MDGLTTRDKEFFELIAEHGGKTFVEVLAMTFYFGLKNPKQQARNRIGKIKKKYKLLRLVPTGLMNPRHAIAFNEFGKRWIKDETKIEVGSLFLSPVTVWHGVYEQIAWFWLKKSGREVSRTIVKNWSLEHEHTPDLLYFHKGDQKKPVYVEIETNLKSNKRYLELLEKCDTDGVHAILYVFENRKKMIMWGNKIPFHEKISVTNITDMIVNISEKNKIGSFKQDDQEFLRMQENGR